MVFVIILLWPRNIPTHYFLDSLLTTFFFWQIQTELIILTSVWPLYFHLYLTLFLLYFLHGYLYHYTMNLLKVKFFVIILCPCKEVLFQTCTASMIIIPSCLVGSRGWGRGEFSKYVCSEIRIEQQIWIFIFRKFIMWFSCSGKLRFSLVGTW